ncbi:MAG: hypothetical protein LC650_00780 [Actinobacteria bacterium]|nr:hypothetical protein [Actinomycetota bacterium]
MMSNDALRDHVHELTEQLFIIEAEARQELEQLREENERLVNLARAFERRVTCPQCGWPYHDRACGPTHAAVWSMIS